MGNTTSQQKGGFTSQLPPEINSITAQYLDYPSYLQAKRTSQYASNITLPYYESLSKDINAFIDYTAEQKDMKLTTMLFNKIISEPEPDEEVLVKFLIKFPTFVFSKEFSKIFTKITPYKFEIIIREVVFSIPEEFEEYYLDVCRDIIRYHIQEKNVDLKTIRKWRDYFNIPLDDEDDFTITEFDEFEDSSSDEEPPPPPTLPLPSRGRKRSKSRPKNISRSRKRTRSRSRSRSVKRSKN